MQIDQPPIAPTIGYTCWFPPPAPLLKVNFDGVLFMDTSQAGIGVVIRDSAGKVIGALSDRIVLPTTVDDVEAAGEQLSLR